MTGRNTCKANALKAHLKARGPFDFVAYGGDGKNDLCAAAALTKGDVLFPRRDYPLAKVMAANGGKMPVGLRNESNDKVQVRIFSWIKYPGVHAFTVYVKVMPDNLNEG